MNGNVKVRLIEGGGVYVVETVAPAGTELGSHRHSHDHISVLVSGHAYLTLEGSLHGSTRTPMRGYESTVIKAGQVHKVEAVTDIVWLCIWKADQAPKAEMDTFLQGLGCAGCPGGCEQVSETDFQAQCSATRFTTDDARCGLPAGHEGWHDYNLEWNTERYKK